jgi:hypothetical protein
VVRLVRLHLGPGRLESKGGAYCFGEAGRCSGSDAGGGASALAHFPRPPAALPVDVDAENREHPLVALLVGRELRVLGAVLVVVALLGRVLRNPIAVLSRGGLFAVGGEVENVLLLQLGQR